MGPRARGAGEQGRGPPHVAIAPAMERRRLDARLAKQDAIALMERYGERALAESSRRATVTRWQEAHDKRQLPGHWSRVRGELRAGSGCLNRFPRTISGVLPGLLSLPHRVGGRREGVARPEVHPLCGAETFMPPPRWASVGSKPRPGCVGQGSNADAVDCRSRDSGRATRAPRRPCRRL